MRVRRRTKSGQKRADARDQESIVSKLTDKLDDEGRKYALNMIALWAAVAAAGDRRIG